MFIKKNKILRVIYRIIRNKLIGLGICGHSSGCKNIYDEKIISSKTDIFKLLEPGFIEGKTALELGPGNNLICALYLVSKGLKKYICVDKYNKPQIDVKLFERYKEFCDEREKKALDNFFTIENNKITSENLIVINDDLFNAEIEPVDMIFSNLTLEHIKNVDGLFFEFNKILKKDGVMLHSIDLSSHDADRETHPLEFLTYSDFLYNLMTSNTDAPNRLVYPHYRGIIEKHGLEIIECVITGRHESRAVEKVKNKLNNKYKKFTVEELNPKRIYLVLKNTGKSLKT